MWKPEKVYKEDRSSYVPSASTSNLSGSCKANSALQDQAKKQCGPTPE